MGQTTATDDDLSWASVPEPRSSAMPFVGESMTPWLLASLSIGVLILYLAVAGVEVGGTEQVVLTMGLCGTMTAAALVVVRSRRALAELVEEERSRPASDELVGPREGEHRPYAAGMERWTASTLELIEHALSQMGGAEGSPNHTTLVGAAEDTRELHALLAVDAAGELPINDQAKLHALCSLWETGQPRVEQIAGATDPVWYRQWRARAVADRQLRHGHSAVVAQPLPYRD